MKKAIVFLLVIVAFFFLSGAPGLADNISPARLDEINKLWRGSAHALADVNCSSCHLDGETKVLVKQPTQESCRSCHEVAVETFLLGKHGIRIAEGLSPLQPKMAHLPMNKSAGNRQMTCNSCHEVHGLNTFTAAVDSCLSCHNDQHSLNYAESKHGQLFAREGILKRPSGKSVTCAACHLPRMEFEREFEEVVHVNHNNTYNLLPRDRMVKDVCMNCHGLEYSFRSIFDDELVEANFAKAPTMELQTLDMIRILQGKK